MNQYDNKEQNLTGLPELMLIAMRNTWAKVGDFTLSILDKVDTGLADRINTKDDE